MIRTLKTALLSLVVIGATAGTAFAGVAYMDETAKVKDEPYKWADTIGVAKEGKKVWVGECFKGYCYIEQKKGEDGWVKKSALEFKKWDDDEVEIEFCVGGGGFGGGGFGFGEICVEN